MSYTHLILSARDPVSLICRVLEFKFIWLMNVCYGKDITEWEYAMSQNAVLKYTGTF